MEAIKAAPALSRRASSAESGARSCRHSSLLSGRQTAEKRTWFGYYKPLNEPLRRLIK